MTRRKCHHFVTNLRSGVHGNERDHGSLVLTGQHVGIGVERDLRPWPRSTPQWRVRRYATHSDRESFVVALRKHGKLKLGQIVR